MTKRDELLALASDARLSAQQREPVVREQKFSKIMHQIALWPEDSARSSSGK